MFWVSIGRPLVCEDAGDDDSAAGGGVVRDCNVELLLVAFSRVLLIIAVGAGGGKDDTVDLSLKQVILIKTVKIKAEI